jgi:hypothetical protein
MPEANCSTLPISDTPDSDGRLVLGLILTRRLAGSKKVTFSVHNDGRGVELNSSNALVLVKGRPCIREKENGTPPARLIRGRESRRRAIRAEIQKRIQVNSELAYGIEMNRLTF